MHLDRHATRIQSVWRRIATYQKDRKKRRANPTRFPIKTMFEKGAYNRRWNAYFDAHKAWKETRTHKERDRDAAYKLLYDTWYDIYGVLL
jgi:hypothetical protein